jgi:NAD+ synthase (glutamine-hydrolysing)
MRIALAQLNTKVADLPGNSRRILEAYDRARGLGAELVVFPEQSLPGYPCLDLWEEKAFLEASEAALKTLASEIDGPAALVGFVARNKNKAGRAAFNACALIEGGKVRAVRHKTLLPTYDVFDESRYFESAESNAPIAWKGLKLGVTICEDAWAGEQVSSRRLYALDPVQAQAKAGADILLNLSASPFVRGKSGTRVKLLSKHAKKAGLPLLYCNLVGGNDELVFDGQSLAFDVQGRLCARAKAFEEDLILIDTEKMSPASVPPAPEDIEEIERALELGLSDYVRKCGFSKVLVGLSGGIDSALVCALAVRALGAGNVTGVSMPSPFSSKGSKDDAKALADNLGIRYLTIPITGLFKQYLKDLKKPFAGSPAGLAEQNVQARIRGNLLMALANKENSLVLSTGNKSELAVGYCTLYGDMSGGLAVIADVPKTTVYALANHINRHKKLIPQASIDKAPSAELKPNQKDQDDLPPYDVLDQILEAYVEERLDAKSIARRGFAPELVADVLRRIDRAEYKRRQAAPSLKVSPKAYGVGRRMPIARA